MDLLVVPFPLRIGWIVRKREMKRTHVMQTRRRATLEVSVLPPLWMHRDAPYCKVKFEKCMSCCSRIQKCSSGVYTSLSPISKCPSSVAERFFNQKIAGSNPASGHLATPFKKEIWVGFWVPLQSSSLSLLWCFESWRFINHSFIHSFIQTPTPNCLGARSAAMRAKPHLFATFDTRPRTPGGLDRGPSKLLSI